VIIGILGTLGTNHHAAVRESALNEQAVTKLVLLQSAQKSYYLETNTYYPSVGSEDDEVTISQNLRVLLPTGSSQVWDYLCDNTGCVQATRVRGVARTWRLCITQEEPEEADTCPSQGGSGCP
jgi:hypothetical protein